MMRTYLSTIQTRSDAHKQRFALAVSGGATLLIFAVWSFVTFGVRPATVADQADRRGLTAVAAQAVAASPVSPSGGRDTVTPFEALGSNVKETWGILTDEVGAVVGALRSSDLETKYDQVKSDALTQNAGQ